MNLSIPVCGKKIVSGNSLNRLVVDGREARNIASLQCYWMVGISRGERGKNYYQCPLPHAPCPMPNNQQLISFASLLSVVFSD